MDTHSPDDHQAQQDRSAGDQGRPPISAANEVDPDFIQQTSLSQAPNLGQAFDPASGKDGLGPPIGVNSQQVGETGSRNNMRPPQEMAEGPDREQHTNSMSRDDQAAMLAQYQAIAQDMNQRMQAVERQRSQGRSLG
ncbi:MAG: hypothetical protein AAFR76_03965 [Planctomycetota bacterium]